jgi:phage-related protein
MGWEIELYEKSDGEVPVREFFRGLPLKHQAKSDRALALLKDFGVDLREPHAHPVKGERYKGIWELRVKFASDISRIFYFLPAGKTFIILHGYVKKDAKLDISQLEIARKYMLDYLERTRS